MKISNICAFEISEGNEKGQGWKALKEIMFENPPTLAKDIVYRFKKLSKFQRG